MSLIWQHKRKRIDAAKDDMTEAIEALALGKKFPVGRRVFTLNGKECIVKTTDTTQTVIVTPSPPYDFTFIPVASEMPLAPADASEDYRNGVSGTVMVYGDQPSHPLLALGDHLPAGTPLGVRSTVAQDLTVTHKQIGGAVTGTTTWYGDTGTVIHWNGIGSMDAAGNDYRTYDDGGPAPYYTVPPYEGTYYPRSGENHTAPDSAAHLYGDRYYTRTSNDHKKNDACTLYRNGYEVARMTWPVLAACEFKEVQPDGTTKVRLRVLCGRWLTPYRDNPVPGNPTFWFETTTLNGFYLYDQTATGWKLTTIECPVVDPAYSNETMVAQAPIFDHTGTYALGLFETCMDENKMYSAWNGKNMRSRQAYVMRIDAGTGLCTVFEPASVFTTSTSASNLTTTQTHVQTLSVAPAAGGTVNRITRTEVVVAKKNRLDSESMWHAGDIAWWRDTQEDTEAWISDEDDKALAACQTALIAQYAASHGGVGPDYMTLGVWTASGSPGSYHPTCWAAPSWNSMNQNFFYKNHPILGWGTGSASYTASQIKDRATWWGGCVVTGPVAGAYPNRSQKTTTTRTVTFNVFGTTVSTAQTTVSYTAGYDLKPVGDGITGYYPFTPIIPYGNMPGIGIIINIGFDIVLRTPSSTTASPLDLIRIVASDPRKGAAIVKNSTKGTFTFVGISGSLP